VIFVAAASVLLAGSIFYCVLVVVAALREAREARVLCDSDPRITISVLKPLAGLDEDLRENLVSFFEQEYRGFELIFAVRHVSDPAVPIVQSLIARYPNVPCRLLTTGESPDPNAKVHSLSVMTAASSHELLVMSDSDIRVDRKFLSRIANEAAANWYDLATCPYRAVPGRTIWSRLEATGMNTEFWGGALAAKLTEGVRFAIGPTIIARREVIAAIPWKTLGGYLAEDFVLGQRASEKGFRVNLSHCVVEHRLRSDTLHDNLLHRLRWARSTRRSRRWGYIGQVFTHPLPVAFLACLGHFSFWPLIFVICLLRSAAAWAVSKKVLHTRVAWHLLPFQDLAGFAFWIAGFFGNSIEWRGQQYLLNRDGTVEQSAAS